MDNVCLDCCLACQENARICDMLTKSNMHDDELALTSQILQLLLKMKCASLAYIKLRYGLLSEQMESIINFLTIAGLAELQDVFKTSTNINLTPKGVEFITKAGNCEVQNSFYKQ